MSRGSLWGFYRFLREDRRNMVELATILICVAAAVFIGTTLVRLGSTAVDVSRGIKAPAMVVAGDPAGYNDGHIVVNFQPRGFAEPIFVHVQSDAAPGDYPLAATVEVIYNPANVAGATYINTFAGIWGGHTTGVVVSLLLGAAGWFFAVAWRKARALGMEESPEADVRIQRGNTLLGSGDSAGAIREYSLAIAVNGTPVGYVLRGDARAYEQDWPAALDDYRKAARIYRDMGRPEDAATVERRISAASARKAARPGA